VTEDSTVESTIFFYGATDLTRTMVVLGETPIALRWWNGDARGFASVGEARKWASQWPETAFEITEDGVLWSEL
jgi:hypothetical protein